MYDYKRHMISDLKIIFFYILQTLKCIFCVVVGTLRDKSRERAVAAAAASFYGVCAFKSTPPIVEFVHGGFNGLLFDLHRLQILKMLMNEAFFLLLQKKKSVYRLSR